MSDTAKKATLPEMEDGSLGFLLPRCAKPTKTRAAPNGQRSLCPLGESFCLSRPMVQMIQKEVVAEAKIPNQELRKNDLR